MKCYQSTFFYLISDLGHLPLLRIGNLPLAKLIFQNMTFETVKGLALFYIRYIIDVPKSDQSVVATPLSLCGTLSRCGTLRGEDGGGRICLEHPSPILPATRDNVSREGNPSLPCFTEAMHVDISLVCLNTFSTVFRFYRTSSDTGTSRKVLCGFRMCLNHGPRYVCCL